MNLPINREKMDPEELNRCIDNEFANLLMEKVKRNLKNLDTQNDHNKDITPCFYNLRG